MENLEIQEKIKKEEENLQILENIYNEKYATYKEFEQIFAINDQKVKWTLLTLLNVVYLTGMVIISPNIIIFLLSLLPAEILGSKLSKFITSKIHDYCEMEIFNAGNEMIDAKKEVEKTEKTIDKLKHKLISEPEFSKKDELNALRNLSSSLKEIEENGNLDLENEHKKNLK